MCFVLFHLDRLGLGLKADLGGFEGVFLGHGVLCAVQDVQNQPAVVGETDLSLGVEIMLALGVRPENVVRRRFARDVHVFAQLDISFRAEDPNKLFFNSAEYEISESFNSLFINYIYRNKLLKMESLTSSVSTAPSLRIS